MDDRRRYSLHQLAGALHEGVGGRIRSSRARLGAIYVLYALLGDLRANGERDLACDLERYVKEILGFWRNYNEFDGYDKEDLTEILEDRHRWLHGIVWEDPDRERESGKEAF